MKTTEELSAIQFHVECTMEAKLRFATLHESLGFKTKSQTFEAILYFVSTKDKIDPAILNRIEVKRGLKLGVFIAPIIADASPLAKAGGAD